jgi:hypothetical protein
VSAGPHAKGGAGRSGAKARQGAGDANGIVPEPVQPAARDGAKRRRKRGSRR